MPLAITFPSWLHPEIIVGLPFRWYGLMYVLAFGTAYYLFVLQVRRRDLKIEKEEIVNFFFWGILGLLLGGRIFAAFVYDTTGRYLQNPLLIFWPFDDRMQFTGLQGMSYHGGLLGAVLGFVLYARVHKIDLPEWGDMLVSGIPLGYTFGRLGNFINGELYGRVTTAPWGMIFPTAKGLPASDSWVQAVAAQTGVTIPQEGGLVNLPRHPSQLYEAFFEGIFLWLVLWFLVKDRKPFKGFVIGAYILGYGLVRFVLEYFREPDSDIGFVLRLGGGTGSIHQLTSLLDISMGQILNFLMILGGLATILVFGRLHRGALERQAAAARQDSEARNSSRQAGRRLRKKLK